MTTRPHNPHGRTQSHGGGQRMKLTELPAGASGRVCELSGKVEVCQRLREMGFCESAVVDKISGRHTLLCQLCGVRVALSSVAAQHIVVEPIRGAAARAV
ncbi:ferrous iron transport protein A [Ereboglobus sp. PH5-10]|uniref:FeoA family protein n=1 Tax=Ereboglobus sp. PH5-10 TaxID=2940629 RepID=UPI002404B966|nr:FeoA family protein [Ereboglobus sp. PH5-10]MDF9827836.1 ferrous iron transport protein A [Ereboglobus sp. PH5-10]